MIGRDENAEEVTSSKLQAREKAAERMLTKSKSEDEDLRYYGQRCYQFANR